MAAATSTTVSPYWTRQLPAACLANSPVSMERVCAPIFRSTRTFNLVPTFLLGTCPRTGLHPVHSRVISGFSDRFSGKNPCQLRQKAMARGNRNATVLRCEPSWQPPARLPVENDHAAPASVPSRLRAWFPDLCRAGRACAIPGGRLNLTARKPPYRQDLEARVHLA